MTAKYLHESSVSNLGTIGGGVTGDSPWKFQRFVAGYASIGADDRGDPALRTPLRSVRPEGRVLQFCHSLGCLAPQEVAARDKWDFL